MFDIGFQEILLAAVVSLLVVGPKQLPELLRTLAQWLHWAKTNFANIKAKLEQELGLDEIREQIRSDDILEQFTKNKEALHQLDEKLSKNNIDFMDSLIKK